LIKAEINNLVLIGPITIINIINDKGKNEKNSKLRTQNLKKPILENGSSLCTSLFL
jgi:aspartate carbamoyltransferase regulatory subunit